MIESIAKIVKEVLAALIGAWTVLAMSTKSIYGSPLNRVIAFLGCSLMIFISYLESKGEV